MMKVKDRTEHIIQLGKEIQARIDTLKRINCSIDCRYNSICIFDDDIKPEIMEGCGILDEDYANQIVYNFNTSRV